jgi:hypothetical protein
VAHFKILSDNLFNLLLLLFIIYFTNLIIINGCSIGIVRSRTQTMEFFFTIIKKDGIILATSQLHNSLSLSPSAQETRHPLVSRPLPFRDVRTRVTVLSLSRAQTAA